MWQEVCKEIDYTVTAKPLDAAIVIVSTPKDDEKPLTIKVTLTSTIIREEIMAVSESNKNVKEEDADRTEETAVDGKHGRARLRFVFLRKLDFRFSLVFKWLGLQRLMTSRRISWYEFFRISRNERISFVIFFRIVYLYDGISARILGEKNNSVEGFLIIIRLFLQE